MLEALSISSSMQTNMPSMHAFRAVQMMQYKAKVMCSRYSTLGSVIVIMKTHQW